ncbi:hypothetical protein SAMN02745229_00812 [Butyrivibrio fibrisolvens DSM 3071]|jgi:hypothetical protein|uniref:Uncharacterized protein n=1 Tax=Butyrivibrio fibrisolvens DSM 3071 TaxID=1121131 RepID=A0A1M5V046_BUTFI|nr:hypothetical protein [Butyrivibrio fibrisolvens]SHH68625.1 hypothetical protein SAMN02745229_00812 [Butyrivibrio fibrisolvens DSM 3071]
MYLVYFIEVIILFIIGMYGLAQAFVTNKVVKDKKGKEKSTKPVKVSGAFLALASWLLAGYIIYHFMGVQG